nr:isoform 2 of probable lrr receptor-like protein kinase [Quercus suber]
MSDAVFVDTGISQKISSEFKSSNLQQTWNLRSFPQGIRNCYSINITQGIKYLIRATFLYGNYDGQSRLPQFDVHLGPNMWDTVRILNASFSVNKELIHAPSQNYLQVCLVNTGLGTPFISAIELRPLNNDTYVSNSTLALFVRLDIGSVTNAQYRYPDDIYDRIWSPYNYKQWNNLSTSSTIVSNANNIYQPPSVVMSTAATPTNNSLPLNFYWVPDDPISQYYIYIHFAELVILNANQLRSFAITINGEIWLPSLVPQNLSSSGLTGEISAEISNLVMLQYLDLSSNSLTGPVPDFLSQLQYLRVLNLERNQLIGSIPAKLMERSKNGSLSLSLGENSNLCGSDSCEKKNNIIIPIVGSVGGLFILSLTVAAILWGLRKRKQQDKTKGANPKSFESIQQQFKYSDVLNITNNFTRILGKGGFGKVYHGYIGHTQVAVKMLSPTSVQGYSSSYRLTEKSDVYSFGVVLLKIITSRPVIEKFADENIHISQWVSFMLAQGDIINIVDPRLQGAFNMNSAWKAVEIAMLCVSSTSTTRPTMSQVVAELKECLTTEFAQKEGYEGESNYTIEMNNMNLDTELNPVARYSSSYRLTEKSDVYSFGVVLLKIITSRPVIEKFADENIHISQWVSFMLAQGDIINIVDPRLQGAFNMNSAWKAVEIAMLCVSSTSTKRPTMSQVVAELKECLTTEFAQKEGYEGESNYTIEMNNMNLDTELNPVAR